MGEGEIKTGVEISGIVGHFLCQRGSRTVVGNICGLLGQLQG